jgi:hypothetical protein
VKRHLRPLAHQAARAVCTFGARRFDAGLADVESTQRGVLARQLARYVGSAQGAALGLHPGLSAESFQERVSEHAWSDVEALVQRQRGGESRVLTGEACERYQPTSGSSSRVKWVPYTPGFLDDLDAAVTPWVADLYKSAPGVRTGQHYWSLSWIPTDLRAGTPDNINDDTQLLSWEKRAAAALMAPVPRWVAYARSSEDSLFATLAWLLSASDLSLISVWSPTFALNLFEGLGLHRDELIRTLLRGHWQRPGMPGAAPCSPRAAGILLRSTGPVTAELMQALWPSLAVVSAWDTSSSARWADRLRALIPHARFQGKGLWATEGVVTIPYRGVHVLASQSHFYEFVDLHTERAHFAWELREGQEVRPLLTTGGGLLRYALSDRLRVGRRLGDTPSLEFVGRMNDADMVGEKLSPEAAERALTMLDSPGACAPVSLFPMPSGLDPARERPCYVALCEGEYDALGDRSRSEALERGLREFFHYELARDLGQLAEARVLTTPNARALYEELGVLRGMVQGNIKVEPLSACIEGAAAAHLREVAQPVAHRVAHRAAQGEPSWM